MNTNGHTHLKTRLLGSLLGILAVTIFGITLPVTHLIVDTFSTTFITAARVTIAGFCALSLWCIVRFPIPQKHHIPDLLLIAFGLSFGFPFFMTWAMSLVPASHGGAVLALLPMATALYATFLTQERPSALFWAIAVLGAISTLGYSLLSGVKDIYLGDFILLFAIVTAALAYALSGRLVQRGMPGWQVISWSTIFSVPLSLPVMIYSWPNVSVVTPTVTDWVCLLYLALFSQYLAFYAWNTGLAIGGIAHVSQVQLLQPFITIIGAWALYDEHIDALTLAFAGYIVMLILFSKKTKVHNKYTLRPLP